MKVAILFFILITCFYKLPAQKNFNKNNYLTLVSATKETQITGAHSDHSNSEIYEVTWKAKRNFFIKQVFGEIDNYKLTGKLFYNNVIIDSTDIINGTLLIMRFEKNANGTNMHLNRTIKSRICKSQEKLEEANQEVIRLSFFIGNFLSVFNVNLKEKKISTDKQLPQ